jgi:menaquinone-dependent protoporphyrinogen oxidase
MRVLVVFAANLKSTAAIARVIGDQLTSRGLDVDVRPTTKALDAGRYGAVVVGSAVHMRRWDKDAVHYLQDQAPDLAERPTWLFQVGPFGLDAVEHTHTPHSVTELCFEIGAHEIRTFEGALHHNPATRWLTRRAPQSDEVSRDWIDIRDWADDVADALQAVPAGV